MQWQRSKDGSFTLWISGPYTIQRWRCHDECGYHYAYAASFQGQSLHGQEPFYDFGTNKPLRDAKRLCEAHAELQQLRERTT